MNKTDLINIIEKSVKGNIPMSRKVQIFEEKNIKIEIEKDDIKTGKISVKTNGDYQEISKELFDGNLTIIFSNRNFPLSFFDKYAQINSFTYPTIIISIKIQVGDIGCISKLEKLYYFQIWVNENMPKECSQEILKNIKFHIDNNDKQVIYREMFITHYSLFFNTKKDGVDESLLEIYGLEKASA
jgi:hypothetical protein